MTRSTNNCYRETTQVMPLLPQEQAQALLRFWGLCCLSGSMGLILGSHYFFFFFLSFSPFLAFPVSFSFSALGPISAKVLF